MVSAVLSQICVANYLPGLPCAGEEAAASRASCLERYREKKLRRVECPTIRYMKRKINADARPRYKVPVHTRPPRSPTRRALGPLVWLSELHSLCAERCCMSALLCRGQNIAGALLLRHP